MKVGIHPEYRTVAFHDTGADKYIMVGLTTQTSRTVEIDGETYPYVTLDCFYALSSVLHRQAENDEA